MLKILKKFSVTDWLTVLLAACLVVVSVWMELSMPEYMSKITMLVQTPGSTMADILKAGGTMLAYALGALAASVATSVCAAKLATELGAKLRRQLFCKVQSFSMEEIGNFSTASLITRSTNDVQQVQMLVVMGLQILMRAPVMAIWAICKISAKSWQWLTATGVAVAFIMVLVIVCVVVVMPKFKRLQELTDNLNRVVRENLGGLRVVRAYNAEAYQQAKSEKANSELTETSLFAFRAMAFMMPSVQMMMNGLSLAIYWIGAYLMSQTGLVARVGLFSDMMAFSQYAMMIVMSFIMLVMIFIMLPRALVAARRINEVLDTETAIVDGERTQGADGLRGEVEFRDVCFQYPDAEESVLQHITFTAHRGETVAFIGATGCGKSTVINLIPRFYDATEGEVLVDGVNVKDYTQRALRNKIGYVSQRATLFTGTVRSNIAFGDNGQPAADDKTVRGAVHTAQADEFVEKLDRDYDGYVAQNGANFSGGQKQRLSIARAIARKPEILIFDDSFSALDYKTDRELRRKLDETCRDTTRLIVAQRIGTIRDADRIVVLDDGRIAGMGRHEELMKSCEVYRQIALSQLSEEELA